MRRGQRAFRLNSKQDRRTCFYSNSVNNDDQREQTETDVLGPDLQQNRKSIISLSYVITLRFS